MNIEDVGKLTDEQLDKLLSDAQKLVNVRSFVARDFNKLNQLEFERDRRAGKYTDFTKWKIDHGMMI